MSSGVKKRLYYARFRALTPIPLHKVKIPRAIKKNKIMLNEHNVSKI